MKDVSCCVGTYRALTLPPLDPPLSIPHSLPGCAHVRRCYVIRNQHRLPKRPEAGCPLPLGVGECVVIMVVQSAVFAERYTSVIVAWPYRACEPYESTQVRRIGMGVGVHSAFIWKTKA